MMKPDAEDPRSDEDLALLAAGCPDSPAGRKAACTVLERYARVVYRWCYSYVGNVEQAEDLAQDVLLRAYRHLGDFEGWGRFSAWLFVITRNLCLDAVRRDARRKREEIELDRLADPAPGPEAELAARREEERTLSLIREHLSEQEQDALWLRCFERMPLDAITRVLGITQRSGARAVLQNARRKLRAALGDAHPLAREGDDD